MFKETLPHFTFDYRYEPFSDMGIQDQLSKVRKYLRKRNGEYYPFTVTADGMGIGAFPIGHGNAYTHRAKADYVTENQHIGKYLTDNLNDYIQNSTIKVLGDTGYTNPLTILGMLQT